MNEPNVVLEEFRFPLGGGRWLNAAFTDGPKGRWWNFSNGGRMTSDQWPAVIANGLSGTPRFGHHTDGRMYSVGRHSILLSRYLGVLTFSERTRVHALLHDAPECLGLGDINSFLKKIISRLAGPVIKQYDDALVAFLMNEVAEEVTATSEQIVHEYDHLFGELETQILDMERGDGKPHKPAGSSLFLWLRQQGLHDTCPEDTAFDWLAEFNRCTSLPGYRRTH